MNYLSGQVFTNSSCALVARIIDPNSGAYILQSSVSTIAYEIWNTDLGVKTTSLTSLVVADDVYNTLQTGSIWQSRDNLGYNFLTTIAGSQFTTAGNFELTVKFVPVSGEVWYQPWLISVVGLYFGT